MRQRKARPVTGLAFDSLNQPLRASFESFGGMGQERKCVRRLSMRDQATPAPRHAGRVSKLRARHTSSAATTGLVPVEL